ncbi:MAG: nitrogen fixation protein NifR [delta proteobacterium ML8_F1]|nr:MAG: nitrogen fixation protein NifR [delta proteobacterium ML8_F1]
MRIKDVLIETDLMLGPMAGVTDGAFRKICREFGLEMSFTEMVSAKGLVYGDKGSLELLSIADEEHPVGVQIFGSDPEFMEKAARLLQERIQFEILDINMGCPTPKIVKNGDGSKLMTDLERAQKIVDRVAKVSKKPVTVKMRTGWDETTDYLGFARGMESAGARMLTVHGRTRNQMYSGKADWTKIKAIKDTLKIPVVGNGDIFCLEDAIEKKKFSGVDGLMIARGAQGNPWLIREIITYFKTGEVLAPPTPKEIYEVIMRHFDLIVREKGEYRGMVEMRKHIGWYVKGMKHASSVRNEINRASNFQEMHRALVQILDID